MGTRLVCSALSHKINLLYPTLQLQNVVYNVQVSVHAELVVGDVLSL